MEAIVLRELSEREHEKLNSFITNEDTELYQVFLGIILTDLMPKGEVTWEKALGMVAPYHTNRMPFCICGVIDAWVRLCMEYKSYGKVDDLDIGEIKGLKGSIEAIVYGLSNSIYYDGHIGTTGKKQNDLEKNYTMIVMNGIPWWEYKGMYVDPELMYRFIMTYLEKLGFRSISQSDNTRKIDLEQFRGIEFNE